MALRNPGILRIKKYIPNVTYSSGLIIIDEKQYNIISKVNDETVNSVKDLKKALNKKYKINNIEYVKVENDDNKVLMMPLKEINEIDKHFSSVYNYPVEK